MAVGCTGAGCVGSPGPPFRGSLVPPGGHGALATARGLHVWPVLAPREACGWHCLGCSGRDLPSQPPAEFISHAGHCK